MSKADWPIYAVVIPLSGLALMFVFLIFGWLVFTPRFVAVFFGLIVISFIGSIKLLVDGLRNKRRK